MKQKKVRIENWMFCTPWGVMTPPKPGSLVAGSAIGYPGEPDGAEIHTSRVTRCLDRWVKTQSDNVYELGEVNDLYLEWMRGQDPEWNPYKPFEVHPHDHST